jgi:uncharacterized protein with GYD domain
MPQYVSLLRYTQQGIANLKDSPVRLDAARKGAEKLGGIVHDWFLTMGQYDAVLIAEFPDDETCARFFLSIGTRGNVTTQTMRAFTELEYGMIVGSLG